jgi:hypothetical protein
MHVSLSVPIMFSHLLRPPTAAGGATGAGVTAGDCDGVTAGACEGVTAGAGAGIALGLSLGVVLGVLWAKAVPAMARRAAVLSVLNMTDPFVRFG